MTATTEGFLLGGRLRYRQPRDGFRSGIEAILLAASVPARAGDRVIEAGTGAGAALLCLGARVPEIEAVGIELDAELAAMAAANASANGLARMRVLAGDIRSPPPLAPFDHAIANPPYHLPAGTKSPSPDRERAKRCSPADLAAWCLAMGEMLRWRGTLTLTLPVGLVPAVMAAIDAAECGSPALAPLWPRGGHPAKLCLIRAIKGGRAPFRLLAGLVLHQADGGFTPEAQAVLRDGAAIAL